MAHVVAITQRHCVLGALPDGDDDHGSENTSRLVETLQRAQTTYNSLTVKNSPAPHGVTHHGSRLETRCVFEFMHFMQKSTHKCVDK